MSVNILTTDILLELFCLLHRKSVIEIFIFIVFYLSCIELDPVHKECVSWASVLNSSYTSHAENCCENNLNKFDMMHGIVMHIVTS